MTFDEVIKKINEMVAGGQDNKVLRELNITGKFVELSEENAIKYFVELYSAFKNFLKNNDVLEDNKYMQVYDEVIRFIENSNFENECFCYYFEYEGKKYGLNISDDLEFLGYNQKHFNFSEDIVFCELFQFGNLSKIEYATLASTFAYDKKENKCVELFDLSYFSDSKIKITKILESENDEAFDRVLKRVKEMVE